MLAFPLRIDDQLDPPVTLLAFRGRVGDDGVVRAVAYDKELVALESRAADQDVVNGHRPSDRQLVVIAPLGPGDRVGVRMALNPNNLVGIGTEHFGRHVADQVDSPGRSRALPDSNRLLPGISIRITSPSRRTKTPGTLMAGSVWR